MKKAAWQSRQPFHPSAQNLLIAGSKFDRFGKE
jgi:hypothetical protein